MRIVGGKWKGRLLEAPQTGSTRPTQDRIREALVSQILAMRALSLENTHVLDAFAGSGAVGLELLSRGAVHATFGERDKKAALALQKNIAALSAEKLCDVFLGNVVKNVESYQGKSFDIVFLDPPYKDDPLLSNEVLTALFGRELLNKGALIVHERAQEKEPLTLPFLRLVKDKKYGSTCVALYTVKEKNE